MAFMSGMKTILQEAWGLAPFTFVCLVLFLRWGIYEYPLAAIVAVIDLIEHIVLNRGWYFEAIKILGIISLLLYLASRWILLAYTIIGREHKKMSEECQRLGEKIARLEDELKVQKSRTANMKGHRDSILEDYSVQSATVTAMTDRAVIAECRLAETMNDLDCETETVAKLTRNFNLSESSKDFLLVKLEGYDKCRADTERYKCDTERYKRDAEIYKQSVQGYESCKADVERYKCDAERYKCDAERYKCDAERCKRGIQHYRRKARIAEEDCSANLFEFDDQKKALEEEVKALKAKVQLGRLGKGGEEKARRGEDQAGRLEDANIKKIKVLERKIEELETDVENLEDSRETTKAAYEIEIKGDEATIKDLRTELATTKDDLAYIKDELDSYKEDNDERSETIKGLLKTKKQQEKELEDLKKKLSLADLAIKFGNSKSGGGDGDGEASRSDPPSAADVSGAGQSGQSILPSASGTDQAPGNMSNFFGNASSPPARPTDPTPECRQS